MASSLFGSNQTPNDPKNGQSSIFDQFQQFRQMIGTQDPQALVQQLISSGKMSMQDYQKYSAMAQQFQHMFK